MSHYTREMIAIKSSSGLPCQKKLARSSIVCLLYLNKTIITLALVGYKMIIANCNSALCAPRWRFSGTSVGHKTINRPQAQVEYLFFKTTRKCYQFQLISFRKDDRQFFLEHGILTHIPWSLSLSKLWNCNIQ